MAQEEEIIKTAVSQPVEETMQKSLMHRNDSDQTNPPQPDQQDASQQGYQQYDPSYGSQDYSQGYGYQDQQQYSQYTPSSDTISEISEQVVSEKISSLKADINKVIDFKTTFDSKIDFLDQRLKRIEATIDKLQLSILQKVGQYVNDVSDLKSEIIETQKSFKSLLDKKSPHPEISRKAEQ